MSIQGFYTNKGSALAAKIAGGLTALTVTRVVAGSGHTEDIPSATTLPDIKQTLTVGTAVVEGTTATLPVTLAEALAAESYALTELGVYASDPQEGEILMQIYQLPTAQSITALGEGVLRFYLRQTIGAEGAEVVCSPAGILLDGDLDPLRAAINARYTKQETDALLVKKPDAIMSWTTIHVAKTGSDTTGDGSAEHPFLTVQHAVDSLPKCLINSAEIIVHEGNYAENVDVFGFIGGGEFYLNGADGETVSLGTVHINHCTNSGCFLTNVTLSGCDADLGYCVYLGYTHFVWLANLKITQTHNNQEWGAITARRGGFVRAENLSIANQSIAVDVAGVWMTIADSSIRGTVALRSGAEWHHQGGMIMLGNTTVTGTQQKSYGGQIWS